jgi:hypothetical protein
VSSFFLQLGFFCSDPSPTATSAPTLRPARLQWTPEAEAPFQILKEALCAAPILAYPKPGEMFIVDTDTSNIGIGGGLSQVQEGQEWVIAYYSKTLNKAERNYCVT